MSEHTTEEILMYLRQCLLPGNVQEGIDLEIPSWLVRDAVAELEKALGVISMLEYHWISPMEYYEATEELRKRVEGLEEKLFSVLEVAIARGEKLGYEDAAYRKDLEEA